MMKEAKKVCIIFGFLKCTMIPVKLNKLLVYDPAAMPLGVYPEKLKTYIHTKSHTGVLRAALFTTAKTWKQPRHPPGSK